MPDDDELVAYVSSIRFEFTQDGKIQIKTKDAIRKRLDRSPGRADAVALARFS